MRFVSALPKEIKVSQLIVFGSYARGESTPDSDIDLIVISDDFAKTSENQRLSLLYKASRFIDPEIVPWGLTNKELQKANKQTTIGWARDNGIRINL